jgi:KDO2-lipid IV(A) lauroyltransferase
MLLLAGYRKQVINKNYKSTIASSYASENFRFFYRKCILNLSKIMVEALKFDQSKSSGLTYHSIKELEYRCKHKKGLILLASHYGNWELACINLPVHTSLPCYGVYKPLKNRALDKELIQLRSKFGLNLIPMNSIARSIASNFASGIPAIYIFIADQNPRSIKNVIWIKFMGMISAFSNGPEKLKNKYNFPVAYMKNTPGKNIFEYKIEFKFPQSEEEKNITEWYSKMLEDQIKKEPSFWLWSHKRWKRKHTLD